MAFASQQFCKVFSKARTGKTINYWINAGVEHGQKYGDFMLVAKYHHVW